MTTNDTRTQKDRDYLNLASDWAYVAEKAGLAPDATADEIVAGFLSRDAEPTTVTAEQIEAAERRGAVKALRDFADGVRFPNHWVLFRRVEDDSPVSVGDLLRETARNIEGDPA